MMGLRKERVFKCIALLCLLSLFPVILLLFTESDPECDRFSFTRINITQWQDSQTSFCNGNYVGYAHRYFTVRYALFDPKADRFSIPCNSGLFWRTARSYAYYGKHGVYAPGRYTKSLLFRGESEKKVAGVKMITDLTIAVYREYPHNFYHAMTQWYNIYTLSKLLQFDPKSVHILLLDRGPVVHIDEQWRLLYKSVTKASDIKGPVMFESLIFNIAGHESLLYYFELERLPFVEEFSKYFMDMFQVSNTKPLQCSNLTVTLYLRHDYLMHPGDKSSIRNTERKLQNENELINVLKQEFSGHTFKTLVAEDMPLSEQLKLTTNSDVLIGMHGCVLSQTIFLPPHAMVLEMYPITWELQYFFSSIAKWRGIRHDVWQNKVKEFEFPDHKTYIPPAVFRNYSKSIREHFRCTKT